MNMNKKSIEDVAVAGVRTLVRVDFNVPMKDGKITDETRINGAFPTIKYLVDNGAKVILCSHMGRPKGEVNPKYSLAPVAARLSELLGKEVKMAKDVIGEDAKALVASLENGDVMLLENLRFHKEETKNVPEFAKALADFAELYVNDAFGTAHRAHASTEGVTHYLPSVAGYLIEKELRIMGGALQNPARPFVAILGGAKVSDKIGVIKNLLDKVDTLVIGGGMAYTFLKAMGKNIGTSLLEEDKLELATELIAQAKAKNVEFFLPVDHCCGASFSNDAEKVVTESDEIPKGLMGLDIGPKSQALYADKIKSAATVVWNGPMGVFEFEKFAEGTKTVAKALADSEAISIIGGGDSAAAVTQMGFAKKVTHISTGGGASLEFLEGIELPGVAAINDK